MLSDNVRGRSIERVCDGLVNEWAVQMSATLVTVDVYVLGTMADVKTIKVTIKYLFTAKPCFVFLRRLDDTIRGTIFVGYNKSLAIREKLLGKEHPDTADSYNNIANEYYAQDDYARSLEYYNTSLAIRKKVLGKNHENILRTPLSLMNGKKIVAVGDEAVVIVRDNRETELKVFLSKPEDVHQLAKALETNTALTTLDLGSALSCFLSLTELFWPGSQSQLCHV